MLKNKIQQAIELSNQLQAIFVAIDITQDNSKVLEQATDIVKQRDLLIKYCFANYNEQELKQISLPLEQYIALDKEINQLSCSVKDKMSKQIIKQKRNNKATQAYIQK